MVESKSRLGRYNFQSLIMQDIAYASENEQVENVFLIMHKGPYFAFGMYLKDFHSTNNFDRKAFWLDGYIGFRVENDVVYPIAQENTPYCQMQVYRAGHSRFENDCITRILDHMAATPNGTPDPVNYYWGGKYKVDLSNDISEPNPLGTMETNPLGMINPDVFD